MAKWFVAAKKADFQGIADKYKITPMLARIIRNRDITEEGDIERFLHGGLEDLYSPGLLKDMDKAVGILREKLGAGKLIRIIGDYDIDGICSAYILKTGLEYCGAAADTVIPHRVKDGYGLNENLISEAKQDGIDTILTCDNGIAAWPQIAYAKECGITVLITDHHEVPFSINENGEKEYRLPPADAVVDPKQPGCPYPCKEICGAVVAYKLVERLVEVMGLEKEILGSLLEFAAMATVGDVMPLLGENRIIVKYGLLSLHDTLNQGLKALIAVNGIEGKSLTPYHIGYILGPCLNASGRLDTAQRALRLFETQDAGEAAVIAGDLKALNDSRKSMTEKGVLQAVEIIEHSPEKDSKVLVIYLADCHESLAGIVAGRLKEKYTRPVFVITPGEEGVKGSGRSVEAFSMYEEMSLCKELFTKFGGHKMAAGFSMEASKIEEFRKAMNENCILSHEDFEEKIHIDIPMPLVYADKKLTEELELLSPFGMGNPKPLFAQKNVLFQSGKILGKNKNVGKYLLKDEQGNKYDAIYFGDLEQLSNYIELHCGSGQAEKLYGPGTQQVCLSIVYYPEINDFRGNKNLQIVIKDYQ